MFEELKPHLTELRKRLFISVMTVALMFIVCFTFWNQILDFIIAPLQNTLPENQKMVFLEVQEPFFVAMKVAFFTGFLLSLPIIFWQFWLFVAPGLYENEKKYIIPFVVSATFMFLIGAAFCYYVVVPIGFAFLINFGQQLFSAMLNIGGYVGFFTKLVIAFGIAFELPVITFFLAKLGLVDDKMLKNSFRYAIIVIFIFAAVMTPPDILSQFLMAVPLIGLYGLSIFIAARVNPAKNEEPEQENSEEEEDE